MTSLSRNRSIWAGILLASTLLLVATHASAADRFGLSFYSLVPPAGWITETDKKHRLISGGGRGMEPPFMIVESCTSSEYPACPSKCDLPTLSRSSAVSDLPRPLREIKRRDDYVEYAASREDAFEQGKASTSVRLLCGPAGFIFTSLTEIDPARDSERELDAVIDSIQWVK